MKVIIIRHGDPDYSIDSLTEKGWREAELLAKRVSKMDIDAFYCSPLGRAQDTAKPSLTAMQRTAETLDWMREFEGKITSPFTGKKRVSWDLPPSIWCNEARYYDKEKCFEPSLIAEGTAKECYETVTRGVDELLERYGLIRHGMAYKGGEDKTIVLFCHFCLGITVLAYLLGISPIVAQNNFFLAPTSVTTLVTETDSEGISHFRATMVGDISHLYVGGEPMSESGLYPSFDK